MHALVTGAGGFLGLYIVEQLVARGDRVTAFCRGDYPCLRELGVEVIRGDVRDRQQIIDACRGIDTFFHVAAVAGIWGPWDHFYRINTLGTQHVLEGCLAHGVPKLVYSSSPSVTFNGTDQQGVDESAPYADRWMCHYPHTKALAEQMVLKAHGRDGLATCSLRPHLIWGPRDNHLVPRLIERARSGKLRRVGDGTNLIDIAYVENVAEAHLLAADALEVDSPVGGQAYFISQGKPVNCWDWIDELLALAELPKVTKYISARGAKTAGKLLESAYHLLRRNEEPRMTRFLAAQLSTSHYFDIGRAQQDFGYRPTISTAVGMQRLQASWAAEMK